jgi:hypothetical protein
MANTNGINIKYCDKVLLQRIQLLKQSVLASHPNVVTEEDLLEAYRNDLNTSRRRLNETSSVSSIFYSFLFVVLLLVATPLLGCLLEYFTGVRCIVPNNYLVWEATRPVSNCDFCRGLERPLILSNLTREEFAPYAYSSQPIIVKNAVANWPAKKLLNFTYLKDLYFSTPDSFLDDCQFLPFKSNFMSLRDVFLMSDDRVHLRNGETPWYVGWSNCNPQILTELRKLYPGLHFLPKDAELSDNLFLFMGYEKGAIMHLDYIERLMFQAQLKGNKSWIVAPTPECDSLCNSFTFFVEENDAFLLDTRLWYHGTFISQGDFSLTIQSEYG